MNGVHPVRHSFRLSLAATRTRLLQRVTPFGFHRASGYRSRFVLSRSPGQPTVRHSSFAGRNEVIHRVTCSRLLVFTRSLQSLRARGFWQARLIGTGRNLPRTGDFKHALKSLFVGQTGCCRLRSRGGAYRRRLSERRNKLVSRHLGARRGDRSGRACTSCLLRASAGLFASGPRVLPTRAGVLPPCAARGLCTRPRLLRARVSRRGARVLSCRLG
jgi:hypothetical protein